MSFLLPNERHQVTVKYRLRKKQQADCKQHQQSSCLVLLQGGRQNPVIGHREWNRCKKFHKVV